MKEWHVSFSDHDPGSLALHVTEITDGVSTGDRQLIRIDLTLHEMIRLQETVNRALSHHLRMMA